MNARDRIFARLAAVQAKGLYPAPAPADWFAAHDRREPGSAKAERFATTIAQAHAEVHRVGKGDWVQRLYEILSSKNIANLLLAPTTPHGAKAQAGLANTSIDCRSYAVPVEEWKQELFTGIQASFTGARSAIAETGSLILWPDAQEPRLMSLVPPVHIVLLDAERIHGTFFEAMQAEEWVQDGESRLPTNALLISGPSKTADIQQTLAYGAHGPKELVVLLLDGSRQ